MLAFLLLIVFFVGVLCWFVVKDMNTPLVDKLSSVSAHRAIAEAEPVLLVNKDSKINTRDVTTVAVKIKANTEKKGKKIKKTPGRKNKSL
jgi:ribosomal protein L21